METTLAIIIAGIILLLIITPLLYFFRWSTDIRLEGDLLVLRYPFRKEEINLSEELKSWHLQEAYFIRLGKVYSINIELKSGKWKNVSSRFNAESFQILFKYLDAGFSDKRKENN